MRLFNICLSLTIMGITSSFFTQEVYAQTWHDTPCVLGNSKKSQMCKETKSEATLQGIKGWLHTYTFPNGKKFYWFYGNQSILCKWQDTYVKEHGKKSWMVVNPYCGDEWIDVVTPSGSRLFKLEPP
ncbi:hypothetical protein [Richelia sinica]|uniref:hypothetical protein n=1 Tax=Richelia sinica TaxID=1357545 RepID=UPI001683BB7E|nr:hypothetical protein [Richelia sinica]MBD2667370.1 hypothetical protein [Richelia sinica FACHB-800]